MEDENVVTPSPTTEDKLNTPDVGDALVSDLQKKISDAFDIFDHESNKTVDVR